MDIYYCLLCICRVCSMKVKHHSIILECTVFRKRQVLLTMKWISKVGYMCIQNLMYCLYHISSRMSCNLRSDNEPKTSGVTNERLKYSRGQWSTVSLILWNDTRSVWILSLTCQGLQEEKPQTAHPMSILHARYIADIECKSPNQSLFLKRQLFTVFFPN